jgi:hypothetical protein
MRIYLGSPELLHDLLESLERWAWHVDAVDETGVYVSPPVGVPEDAAALELDLYLRAWRARHPGVTAVIEA